MDAKNKNRWMLVGVVALFAAPIVSAIVLAQLGWRPAHTKSYGTLIDPPRDVGAAPVTLAAGGALVWRNPQWQWTLVALPGARCAQHCQAALADVVRMRATLGRNAGRLRVVYLGAELPPEAAAALVPLQAAHDDADTFATWRPQAEDALALALVDPGGFLMMQYPAGYDIAGVRRDLPKVIN